MQTDLNHSLLLRRAHRWLALLVGLQMLAWTLGGFYMVLMDIEFIRGTHLIREQPWNLEPEFDWVSFGELVKTHGQLNSVSLKVVAGEPRYLIEDQSERFAVSVKTGERLPFIDREAAVSLASWYFRGNEQATDATLIKQDPPSEIRFRALPLWRVDFADDLNSSLYIQPSTGELITRRHDYWRLFDFMWMLHIMDYSQRSNTHNLLLQVLSVAASLFGLSGFALLYVSFRRRTGQGGAGKGGAGQGEKALINTGRQKQGSLL